MAVTRSASRSQKGTPASQPPTTTTTTATTTPSTQSSNTPQIDPNTKARTIAHMNKDHQDDMSAILQHRAHLSAAEAAAAEMLDLDLTTMTIRSASGVHAIALAPPMETWDDRRVRLADMTNEARQALEKEKEKEKEEKEEEEKEEKEEEEKEEEEEEHSSLQARAPSPAGTVPAGSTPAARQIPYCWPRGADWVSFAGLTFYWFSCVLVYGGFVTPGSEVWRVLELVRFPYGPVGYVWLVRAILVPVLAIHAFESFYLNHSRLAPAGLGRGSKVWLLWVAAGFFEGLPAYRRWDRLVAGKGLKSE